MAAAIAAVTGKLADRNSPHQLSGTMTQWFGLLNALIADKSDQPGDEAIRARLLGQAVDGGAASLVLTALEAAAHVPGPAGADFRIISNGLKLLKQLVAGDERCWREAIFEDAPPASPVRVRRPAWAAPAAASGAPLGQAPPWTISVAVAVLKRGAARQPTLDSAWFLSYQDAAVDAVSVLSQLGFGTFFLARDMYKIFIF